MKCTYIHDTFIESLNIEYENMKDPTFFVKYVQKENAFYICYNLSKNIDNIDSKILNIYNFFNKANVNEIIDLNNLNINIMEYIKVGSKLNENNTYFKKIYKINDICVLTNIDNLQKSTDKLDCKIINNIILTGLDEYTKYENMKDPTFFVKYVQKENAFYICYNSESPEFTNLENKGFVLKEDPRSFIYSTLLIKFNNFKKSQEILPNNSLNKDNTTQYIFKIDNINDIIKLDNLSDIYQLQFKRSSNVLLMQYKILNNIILTGAAEYTKHEQTFLQETSKNKSLFSSMFGR